MSKRQKRDRRCVGLWIDFRRAVLVWLEEDRRQVESIAANIEPRLRLAGGSRSRTPFGPQDIRSETRREQRRKHQVDDFCARVITRIRDADAILILGPGEAPQELAKRIRRSKGMTARIADIQRSDKMTTRQLTARVQGFFRPADRRRSAAGREGG
jgi:hypothetical protein